MSFDALQLMAPRAAVLAVARVLRRSARFVFTTWELSSRAHVPPHAQARVVRDWRALLEACGFTVESVDEPALWRERQLDVYRRMRDAGQNLHAELGAAAAALVLEEATDEPARLLAGDIRRVLVVAQLR